MAHYFPCHEAAFEERIIRQVLKIKRDALYGILWTRLEYGPVGFAIVHGLGARLLLNPFDTSGSFSFVEYRPLDR